MAIRSTCAATPPATTSPRTACATPPSTAAPIPFNLQQIEIYNGANSVFNGSGSVGGTINLVSKVPQAEDLTILSAAVGTDNYLRGTVDSNWRISPEVAIRLNAMVHRNDVPGRDVENYRRWGVAPAITFGIDGPTSLTLAYVHQRDDNIPIYGVPYFLNQLNDGPLPEADDSDYFGYRNLDEQETTVDRLTATFRHEISERISVRNLLRWQKVIQHSQTSAPQGTFCLSGTGRQPVSLGPNDAVGAPCTAAVTLVTTGNGPAVGTINVPIPPGFYQPSGPRGLVRDQSERAGLQPDRLPLRKRRSGRPAQHSRRRRLLHLGGLRLHHRHLRAQRRRRADPAAAGKHRQSDQHLYRPDQLSRVTARSEAWSRNQAIYAFDTLELGRHFELNAGVRYEWAKARVPGRQSRHLSARHHRADRAGAAAATQRRTAVLLPLRRGLQADAATPASTSPTAMPERRPRRRCGSAAATPATATASDPCAAAPETARNYEIGAKADLFDRRLQLTAALFRNERSNFRVPSNDPINPTLQVLDGRSRVDGLALGVSGNITPEWPIFANYTYLDSEVLQSVSDFCLANPGSAGCANSAAIPDPQRGDRLIQTPRHSGSLFTTYRLPFGLQLGYGLTYQGGFATHQRNLLQRTQYFSDDFLIHRLFVSYAIRAGLTAQLNVQNVTDERYFTNIRNNVNATTGAITGGWAAPGEDRSAVLSLFYSF